MSLVAALFRGELERQARYNIIAASLVVAIVWVGVLHFAEIGDVTALLPLLLMIDSVTMPIILVGASMFFEKQEGSIRSLLVSPIHHGEYIGSKAASTVVTSVLTLVIVFGYARIFREVHLGFGALLGAVVLISVFHALVGVLITYRARDFTGMLMGMFRYVVIIMVPVVLEEVGIIQHELLRRALFLLPTKAASTLLTATAADFAPWEIGASIAYLVLGIVALTVLALRDFSNFAARESGV